MVRETGSPEVSFEEFHSPGPRWGRFRPGHFDVMHDSGIQTDRYPGVGLPWVGLYFGAGDPEEPLSIPPVGRWQTPKRFCLQYLSGGAYHEHLIARLGEGEETSELEAGLCCWAATRKSGV